MEFMASLLPFYSLFMGKVSSVGYIYAVSDYAVLFHS